MADIPATTPLSDQISKDMKKMGFRCGLIFLGKRRQKFTDFLVSGEIALKREIPNVRS